MRPSAAAAATGIVAALAGLAAYTSPLRLDAARTPRLTLAEFARAAHISRPAPTIPVDALTDVVHRVCGECHNENIMSGELSLEKFDVAGAAKDAEVAGVTPTEPLDGKPRVEAIRKP